MLYFFSNKRFKILLVIWDWVIIRIHSHYRFIKCMMFIKNSIRNIMLKVVFCAWYFIYLNEVEKRWIAFISFKWKIWAICVSFADDTFVTLIYCYKAYYILYVFKKHSTFIAITYHTYSNFVWKKNDSFLSVMLLC